MLLSRNAAWFLLIFFVIFGYFTQCSKTVRRFPAFILHNINLDNCLLPEGLLQWYFMNGSLQRPKKKQHMSKSFRNEELVFTNNVETETEVLSALSKLLLRRLPSKSNQTNTLSEHAIKSLKIEIDFAKGIGRPGYVVKPVPWFKRLVNENTDIKRERLRREYESRKARGVDLSMMIPAQYIVVVKLGVPVNKLNQSSVFQLRAAFAQELDLQLENVNIDKIRYHGNDIEMFFVRGDVDPIMFSFDDLIPSKEIVEPDIVESIKGQVPMLNITSIYMQHEVVFASYPEPIWSQVSFPYVMGACGAVVLILTVSLIYCCCKKKEKTLKETDDEIRASQTIFYPSLKPDTKNPLMIQPENDPAYNPTGCVTPVPAQPVRAFKRKGLLERRGSSASLKIKLGPTTPETPRWDGVTPPKECTSTEFLLTAGHRLSCQDLRKSVKTPRAIHQEFWDVPMNHPDKITVAGSGMKNRYRTIIPNEHTRVVLPDSEWDPLSSYINANYIRGYEGEPKAYIATQGPLPASIVDFWHMVWHQKSPIIVMITKLKEKNKTKCENYLPEDYCTSTFGDIDVKVEKTVCKNGYTIRNLVLKCNGECHYVLHFWYTTWPDHKPPESPVNILQLVKDVEQRRYTENNLLVKGPVIVHCSAGIGRTGCFIAISIGMRQLFEEQSVDILGTLCSMRIDRGGMIQTHEQYEFVHHALCQYEKELETEAPSTLVPD